MPVRILTIAFNPLQERFLDDELRSFLLNKTVKMMRPEFFQFHGQPFWSVFIEYENVLAAPVPPADGLDGPRRLLLQRLREWRKEQAEKGGVPVYIIATNKQLADLVSRAPMGLEALSQIDGFGKKKLERFGKEIVEIVRAFHQNNALFPQTGATDQQQAAGEQAPADQEDKT